MNNHYDYDCSDINEYLIGKGFNLSYNSSNRIAMTNEAMSDLCSLDYVSVEDMVYKAALYYRNNSEFFRKLNELGYDVYQASSEPGFLASVYDLTNMKSEEMLFKSTTMEGRTQLDLAIDRTPLSLFDINFFQYTVNAKKMRITRVFDYFNDQSNYTFKSSVAIFSHIMCPHSPFIFAEDGSMLPKIGHYNWNDTQYYLSQYKYTFIKLKENIDNIIENDPDSIIIVMSDHGPRPRSDDRVEMELNISEDEMRRILNAVYFGGKKLDIEGLTGVNTLRKVLEAMGANTPQIDNDPDVIPYPYLKKLHQGNG
jgi:hypothetical protein